MKKSNPKDPTSTLLLWAQKHHFPQMVLAPDLILRASEVSWRGFLKHATKDQLRLVRIRITQWKQKERAA